MSPFLNPGGHLSLPFFPGFVEMPGVMAVVFPYAATRFRPFCCQPSSMLPYYMCPILNPTDHTNALECTLEGALAFDVWLQQAVLQ